MPAQYVVHSRELLLEPADFRKSHYLENRQTRITVFYSDKISNLYIYFINYQHSLTSICFMNCAYSIIKFKTHLKTDISVLAKNFYLSILGDFGCNQYVDNHDLHILTYLKVFQLNKYEKTNLTADILKLFNQTYKYPTKTYKGLASITLYTSGSDSNSKGRRNSSLPIEMR